MPEPPIDPPETKEGAGIPALGPAPKLEFVSLSDAIEPPPDIPPASEPAQDPAAPAAPAGAAKPPTDGKTETIQGVSPGQAKRDFIQIALLGGLALKRAYLTQLILGACALGGMALLTVPFLSRGGSPLAWVWSKHLGPKDLAQQLETARVQEQAARNPFAPRTATSAGAMHLGFLGAPGEYGGTGEGGAAAAAGAATGAGKLGATKGAGGSAGPGAAGAPGEVPPPGSSGGVPGAPGTAASGANPFGAGGSAGGAAGGPVGASGGGVSGFGSSAGHSGFSMPGLHLSGFAPGSVKMNPGDAAAPAGGGGTALPAAPYVTASGIPGGGRSGSNGMAGGGSFGGAPAGGGAGPGSVGGGASSAGGSSASGGGNSGSGGGGGGASSSSSGDSGASGSTPDNSALQQQMAQAQQCQQAQSQSQGPLNTLNNQMTDLGNQAANNSCGDACSQAWTDWCNQNNKCGVWCGQCNCNNIRCQMRSTCEQINQVNCQAQQGCPLTANQPCTPTACNQ